MTQIRQVEENLKRIILLPSDNTVSSLNTNGAEGKKSLKLTMKLEPVSDKTSLSTGPPPLVPHRDLTLVNYESQRQLNSWHQGDRKRKRGTLVLPQDLLPFTLEDADDAVPRMPDDEQPTADLDLLDVDDLL